MVFKTADVVKAEGGVGFGQKGLMMELQSLQEALKVEIQIHQKLVAQMKQDPQNAELKLQLHDLQAKITALSERQKKVVEQLRRDLLVKQESGELRLQTQTQLPLQADGKTTTLVSNQSQSSLPPAHLSTPQNSVSVTPVIATKTLPLMLRAATPTTPIAMMPTPTIAMVTTLTNTPLPSLPNSDPQNLPVSLQTSCKPTNQGMEPVRIVSKNTIVVQTATQPIKVPQFVPPTRQTTRPSSLPQVMPKPPATVASVGLQPVLASPQPLQQPVFLTAKLSSTLLPSSGPVHQLHIFNPLPAPPNPPPGPAILQPCSSVPHTGPPVTQTLPVVAMTPSTSLNQCVTASVHHCGSQFASIHSSAPPSKDQQCSMASTSLETPPSALPSKGQQYSADSTSPETPPSPQSSTTCPAAPTLSGRVEPKTVRTSPTPHPVAPQSPASTSSTPATHSQANTHDPALIQSPMPKRQDNPLKLAFMVSLGLVTHEYLEEIQSKRQERKRRTTANPVYSGAVFEPERKKNTVSYLNSANQACKKRADDDGLSEVCRPDVLSSFIFSFYFFPLLLCVSSSPGRPLKHSSTQERCVCPLTPTGHQAVAVSPQQARGDIHDDFCVVCRRSGQLLMCDACSRVYHLDCLAPALRTCPRGMWICPSCQNQMSKKDEPIDWPGPLAIVHSYISYKAEREEEKQKLEKWSSELQQEREELELRVKQLSDSITICRESRNGVLERQKEMEASMEKVKGLVCLIRGIQLPSPTVMSNGGLDHAVSPHPSTPSEQIQHPSTLSEQIQHPSTLSEQIQHPSNPSEQIQHPSNLTEQTQHPSILTEQTQHPSILTEQTQHPSILTEQTQHPSILTEQTQHPSILTEQTQHPSTPTEQTQHPSTPSKQIQHPSTPSKQIQHPSTPSEQIHHPSEQCSGKVGTLADPSSCRTDSGSCTEFTKSPAAINHLPVGKSAVVTGPNGALEPGGDEDGESVNRNDTGDVNKNNTDVNKNNADVNRYSIRDLRGSPVKPLAEVIQGAE